MSNPPNMQRNTAIMEALKSGESYRSIAKRFGVSHVRIAQLRKWCGLPSRGIATVPIRNEAQLERAIKERARRQVREGVRRGALDKPTACTNCGTELPREKLEGHHHRGYFSPLEVQWLCGECHRKIEGPKGGRPRRAVS